MEALEETCPEGEAVCLSSTGLTSERAIHLAASLAARPRLHTLDLSHNHLGSAAVCALAAQLHSLPELRTLDLGATGAGDDGAAAIASAARACAQLRKLSLMGSFVKQRGGFALAEHLGALRELREIGLGWNKITGAAAVRLAEVVLAMPQVQRFSGVPVSMLREGKLPPVPVPTLRDKMRRPSVPADRELYLNGGGCGAPGAMVVAALLQCLPSDLEAICMPFQDLDDLGAEAIVASAVSAKLPLRFLMFSRNNISDAATARMRELLPHLDDFHLRVNARGG
ncbi:hypothetical protein AB1Y20_000053 [Prymnesium parvum]|uniref:Uncharacterized protein n=1 Tax=Prymnesium parvum TaxID=97485 RepID=A0AB34K7C7_PRYPA